MTLISTLNGEPLNMTHNHNLTVLDIPYVYAVCKGNALWQASLDSFQPLIGGSQMAKKVVLCISNPIPGCSLSLLDP